AGPDGDHGEGDERTWRGRLLNEAEGIQGPVPPEAGVRTVRGHAQPQGLRRGPVEADDPPRRAGDAHRRFRGGRSYVRRGEGVQSPAEGGRLRRDPPDSDAPHG